MPRLELALLGPLSIRRDGQPMALPYDKVRALLVYLAAQPDRALRRGAMAELLWPDQPEAAARHSLSQALTTLRQALGEDADALLAVSRQDITFTPTPDVDIDLLRLSALLAECDRHPHRTAEACGHCARQRMEIATLYRGPFLADLALADCPPFADWAAGLRLWLHERVASAVAALAEFCERQGDDARALDYARRQIEIDPLCEDGHRRVMRRLAAAGERSAALAHFAHCRDLLAAGADLEPEPATIRLWERIRGGFDMDEGRAPHAGGLSPLASAGGGVAAARWPTPPTPFIGREAELNALAARLNDGATRLITLVGPGGIGKTRLALQAAAEHAGRIDCASPAASVGGGSVGAAGATGAAHAPAAGAGIGTAGAAGGGGHAGHVGHADNLSATGAPASGVSASGGGSTSPRCAQFVSLASARSLDQAIAAIADALGLRLHGATDPRAHLLAYLSDTNLLLVLDNVEHLDAIALLAADLLARAPDLHLLVTSRERLRVQGEVVFEVDGLEQPPPDDVEAETIARCAATRLFVDRLHRARAGVAQAPADLPAIARICRLVEGMPLAIELAAAWTSTLSCEAIARELERSFDLLRTNLRDVPARQRSVRAAFDHSWALLADDEQRLFETLSIFRGGFTREAIAAVCEDARPDDIVARLAAKSLVRVSPSGRYDLHELLRQYGEERLQARPADEPRLRARHLACFVSYVASREAALKGRAHDAALAEIARELGNVRAAWRWAIARRQSLALTPAVDALFLYFASRGNVREVLVLFGAAAIAIEEDVLADGGADSGARDAARTRVHDAPGVSTCGAPASGGSNAAGITDPLDPPRHEPLPHEPPSNEPPSNEAASNEPASNESRPNESPPKESPLNQSALSESPLSESPLNEPPLNESPLRESTLKRSRPNGPSHEPPLDETLDGSMPLADTAEVDARLLLVGRLRRGMAGACLRLGYYDRAREYLEQSLAAFRRLRAAKDEAFSLNLLGAALHVVGEYDAEHHVLEEAIRLGRAAHDEWITAYSLNDLALALSQLGNHRAARRLSEESLAIFQRIGDPRGLAFTLTNLGIVSARLGAAADARRLHEHSLALRRAAGDEWGAAVSLRHLGRLFRQAGEQEACERCLTEALRLARTLRTWPLMLDALTDWAWLDADTGSLPRARDIAAAVLGHPAGTPATRASACLLLERVDAPEAARAGRAAGTLRALDSSDTPDEATVRIERIVNELLDMNGGGVAVTRRPRA